MIVLDEPISFLHEPAMSAAAAESPPRAAELPGEWSQLPGGLIDGGEIVLLAIKPSLWRPVIDSFPWLVTTCVFAIGITMFSAALPGLSTVASAQAVLAAGLLRLALAVVRWAATWYVLTNRRILNVRGARSPRISSCPLVDIRNTHVDASSLEKLLQIGTITFVSKHPDELSRFWESIPEPEATHAKIRRAIENALDQYGI